MRSVRPWFWHPFENAAREDGLQLFHWQRSDRIEAAQIYPFARFNKVCFTSYLCQKYELSLENLIVEYFRNSFDKIAVD